MTLLKIGNQEKEKAADVQRTVALAVEEQIVVVQVIDELAKDVQETNVQATDVQAIGELVKDVQETNVQETEKQAIDEPVIVALVAVQEDVLVKSKSKEVRHFTWKVTRCQIVAPFFTFFQRL